ncbi:MAG TPA: hypothetical protein VGH34_12625 [Vicinamibacterales bacterium]
MKRRATIGSRAVARSPGTSLGPSATAVTMIATIIACNTAGFDRLGVL